MGSKKKSASQQSVEIRNNKAKHNYFIGDCYEAGMALLGTEVKSIREGNAQLVDAFCRVEKGELWLYHAHIGEYSFGNFQNHEPRRKRKLLLKRREINKLRGSVEKGGQSIIPLRMYLKHGLIKLELALCTGKKLHDKRETLKKKISLREAERDMRAYKGR